MNKEQRWCPACNIAEEQDHTWECSRCGSRLWTFRLLWQELHDALSLRRPSKGGSRAEAGRLRLDIRKLEQKLERRTNGEHEAITARVEGLEKELLSINKQEARFQEIAGEMLKWLRLHAKGSAPLKSIPLKELKTYIQALQGVV